MEIERKFLVNDLNGINLEEYEYKKMAQDYLYIDKFSVVRIRKIETAKGKKFKYTIKTAIQCVRLYKSHNIILTKAFIRDKFISRKGG